MLDDGQCQECYTRMLDTVTSPSSHGVATITTLVSMSADNATEKAPEKRFSLSTRRVCCC